MSLQNFFQILNSLFYLWAQWKCLIKLSVQTERNKCTLYLIILCLISWVKYSIRDVADDVLHVTSYYCALWEMITALLSCAHLLLSLYSLLAMILLRRYVQCSRSLSMLCICVEPLCVSICVFFCILFCKHWQVVDGIIPSLSTPTCTHLHTHIQYMNAEARLMTIDFPNCCPSIIDYHPSCPVHDDLIIAITHTITVNRLSSIHPSHRTPKKCQNIVQEV